MPNSDSLITTSRSSQLLVLTGQRSTDANRRQAHVVFFCGQAVFLTNTPFNLLLDLARCRFQTHLGYLQVAAHEDPDALRLGIHRLRRQIDARHGAGTGTRWIETGMGSEYRLAFPPESIIVTPGFSELPRNLVPTELRNYLAENCVETTPEESNAIGMQLD